MFFLLQLSSYCYRISTLKTIGKQSNSMPQNA